MMQRQGSRVRIPSPTFPFEECIVRVEKKMKKKEEEEEEDRELVKREERGRQRGHSNQERLRERFSVRFKKENDEMVNADQNKKIDMV